MYAQYRKLLKPFFKNNPLKTEKLPEIFTGSSLPKTLIVSYCGTASQRVPILKNVAHVHKLKDRYWTIWRKHFFRT